MNQNIQSTKNLKPIVFPIINKDPDSEPIIKE